MQNDDLKRKERSTKLMGTIKTKTSRKTRSRKTKAMKEGTKMAKRI